MMRKLFLPTLLCVFYVLCITVPGWTMVAIPIDETPATSATRATGKPAAKSKGQAAQAGTASVPTASAEGKTPTPPAKSTAKSSSAGANAAAVQAESALGQATIVGIVLKSIDSTQVCAEDGRVFPLTSSTTIVEQRTGTRMPTAQLLFRSGVLRQVIITK